MRQSSRFVVEIRPPDTGWEALQQMSALAREAAAAVQAQGGIVRFVRSVFAPDMRTCFFIYEAASIDAVREAVDRTGFSAGEAVRTGGPDPRPEQLV